MFVNIETAVEAHQHMVRTGDIPYAFIKAVGLQYVQELADAQGLETKLVGNELQMLNPRRNDTEFGSYSINVETGLYADFAVDDCSGSDVISWVAYNRDCKPSAAAKWILDQLVLLEGPDSGSGSGSAVIMEPARQVIASPPDPSDASAFADVQIPEDYFRTIMQGQGLLLEDWYDYRSAAGGLQFVMLRLRDIKSGKKTFKVVHPASTSAGEVRWIFKMPGGLRPLYNLPALVAEPTAPVYVVEGEKAAKALQRMLPDDVVVVTTAGGSNGTRNADLAPLGGRQVRIWPDHDEAGARYARVVAQQVLAHDPRTPVAVIDTHDLFERFSEVTPHVPGPSELSGWDAADVEDLGLYTETLELALSESARKFELNASGKDRLVEPVEESEEVEPVEEVVEDASNVTWLSFDEYRLTPEHVQLRAWKKDPGEQFWETISSRIEIRRQLRDHDGQGWSLDLGLRVSDGSEQVFILPRSTLSDVGATKTALLDRGVVMQKPSAVMNYLSQAQPSITHDLVHQVGWAGGNYVLGDRVYGYAAESVALHPNAPVFRGYAVSGDLDAWNNEIGRLCVGNSRLMMAVLATLAGPLTRLAGVDSGGFHFYGISSSGKTTLLIAAASVLGPWKDVVRTWRSTSNALEGVAAGLNDGTLFLDEIGQVKAEEIGEIVYMLANGQGKGRMTRTGQQARLLTWTLLILSTGEIPLQQVIESGGGKVRAGMELRLVNVPADAEVGLGVFENLHGFTSSKDLADHLRRAAGERYGSASEA